MARLPLCTIIFIILCLISSTSGELAAYFVYHHSTVAEGEYWRLLTCHLVHFTHKQLLLNVAFFAILATMVELQMGKLYLLLLYASLALSITLLLPFTRPLMIEFGGLSGINYGLLVTVALKALSRSETRSTGLIVLLFVGLNLTFQAATGNLLVNNDFAGLNIEPVWEAHLAGCLMALLYFTIAFIPIVCQSAYLKAASYAAPLK